LAKILEVALKEIPKPEEPKPSVKAIEVVKPNPKVEVPKVEPKEVPKPEPKVVVEVPKPEPKVVVEVPKVEPKVEVPKPEPKVEVTKVEPKEVPKFVSHAGSNAANFDTTPGFTVVPSYARMNSITEKQFLMKCVQFMYLIQEKQVTEKIESASILTDSAFTKHYKAIDEAIEFFNEKMK
jgi:outer membrane biosynthesis protein TonB